MNFFPILYPDEMLYSAIARYCIKSGNIRNSHNFEDLFGKTRVAAVFELPTQLNTLISNMPIGTKYTAEYLIENHTLFPVLVAFISKERAGEIKENMKQGDGSISHGKLGTTAFTIEFNRYFKFCPECFKEDIKRFGEPYWHRVHQITGVFVCPIHNIPLHKSNELIRGKNQQVYIAANEKNCVVEKEIFYSDEIMEKMIWMAKDVQKLLDKNFDHKWRGWFKNQFRVRLIEKKYARMNNYVEMKRLKSDFIEFYGEEYLSIVQSSIPLKGACWLSGIIRYGNQFTYALRYLLLAQFLEIDLEELFNKGLGVNNENDEVDVVDIYQEIWDKRLIELAGSDLSIRSIAKILNSSPTTVRRSIDRLGIEPFWKYNGGGQYINREYINTEEFRNKKIQTRRKWLQLHKKYENKSSNEMRLQHDEVYSWLKKYDDKWLKNNYRKMKKIIYRVNWEDRDRKLLPKVKKVVEQMKTGEPERITWNTIGNRLGVSGWLMKNKQKLLLTGEYIESVSEELEDFHLRKIKWAIDVLEEKNREIKFWSLVEVTGIGAMYLGKLEDQINDILIKNGLADSLISYKDMLS